MPILEMKSLLRPNNVKDLCKLRWGSYIDMEELVSVDSYGGALDVAHCGEASLNGTFSITMLSSSKVDRSKSHTCPSVTSYNFKNEPVISGNNSWGKLQAYCLYRREISIESQKSLNEYHPNKPLCSM